MKECFEIPVKPCDLHEVREGNRVSYRLNDGDTTLVISTSDVQVDKMTVSKYRNAKVEVVIKIDLDDVEYEGVEV